MAIKSKVEVTTKRTKTIILSSEEVVDLVKKHIVHNYNAKYSDIKLDVYDLENIEDVRVFIETIDIKDE